jgi:hypothetical protein
MTRSTTTAAIVLAALTCVAACGVGGSAGPAATVPTASATPASAPPAGASRSGAASAPSVGYSQQRIAQMHAASQCLREHGAPQYQDAVLTGDGHVYTDARALQDAVGKDPGTEDALRAACGRLFTAAGFAPDDESPAPPALVQAGVQASRCLRAHGLTAMRDPDSSTSFTPGHGFGLTSDELPNGGRLGKTDPTVQRALEACRAQLDAEIRASTLAELAHD